MNCRVKVVLLLSIKDYQCLIKNMINHFRQKLVSIVLFLVLFMCCGLCGIFSLASPVKIIPKQVDITIPPGLSTISIARKLAAKQVIKSAWLFTFWARWLHVDGILKSGNYQFDCTESLPQVLDKIMKGEVVARTFTIPEGFTLFQIRELLSREGLINADSFQQLVREGEFEFEYIQGLPLNNRRLEGFLFPDTYQITPDMKEKEIIEMMLGRFQNIFAPVFQERATQLGLSPNQVVILASIVEREAKKEEERPLIAAVFLNRLAQNIRLESCATIQYALPVVKPVLNLEDLKIDSPYNTYLHKGLPPGPIASPGLASIKAVLYPAQVPYLYFLAKNDGTHVFSLTFAEHKIAKDRYLTH